MPLVWNCDRPIPISLRNSSTITLSVFLGQQQQHGFSRVGGLKTRVNVVVGSWFGPEEKGGKKGFGLGESS